MAKISTTYAEDSATLEWIDRTAAKISAYRGGAAVSRADVIRWLTRAASEAADENLTVVEMAAQV